MVSEEGGWSFSEVLIADLCSERCCSGGGGGATRSMIDSFSGKSVCSKITLGSLLS